MRRAARTVFAVGAALSALALGFFLWSNALESRPPAYPEVTWVTVRDRAHLVGEVDKAKAAGRPVVVSFWAKWETYGKHYERLFASDPRLRAGLGGLHLLHVDLTEDARPDLCEALGVPRGAQPYFVFLTARGYVRRSLDLEGWMGVDGSTNALLSR